MLADLCGKPLVQWVLVRAGQAHALDAVIVATDDERIREAVEGAGGEAVMTRPDHPSGTDRVAEAVRGRATDLVVNIQGDEPLVDPALLDRLVAALREEPGWDMATAATPIRDEEELVEPSVVKVVTDRSGRALYFSRSVIPHVREKDAGAALRESLHWRHLGIYAYRTCFLEQLVGTPPCATEEAEKLEQLRALDLGGRMKVLRTDARSVAVDIPADREKAERALRAAGLV